MEGNEINKIVVEAYSSASKALKSVRKESGVTIDSVESAMEMFQDEMDQMQEISDALVSSSVASISDEEKDALQAELDAILREENVSSTTAGTPQANISSALPTAPTTNISISSPIVDADLTKTDKIAVIN